MIKYVAGIDAGTTGLKTIIFDLQGRAIGKDYEEYPCITPRVGWVEQDVYCLWNALCHTVKGAIANAGVDPKEIGSVGISSQRGTFFAIDENWEPLHNSIVWSDGRAVEEVQWIKENIGVEKYHKISGAPVSGAWSYAKYKWVRDHQPELYEKAWKFVNAQEWLLHKLGSEELFTDPASLALNGMMDVATLDWSKELLDAIDFDINKLPPVKEPARQVGTVSKEASDLTGFAEGMAICVGGGDQQCAAIGCGVTKEGTAEITIGTASVMVAAVDGVKEDPAHEVIFSGHAVPGHMDMEGLAYATGVALRWWRDIYGSPEVTVAKAADVDPYDIICMEAAKSPAGSRGYIFFPFFSSQVTPYYHDNARGGSLGISLAHNRADMARGVLEGGGYELRMIVEAINRFQAAYLWSADETLEFVERFDSKRATIHLDTFHINIEDKDMERAIRICKDRLGYFHVSDSDRAHPGHGHFDFKKCIEVLYDIGYDGVLGHEYNADPDPVTAAVNGYEFIKQYLK